MLKRFKSKSIAQLQKYIRESSKNSDAVLITRHAKVQMKLRRVLMNEIYECLREGVIYMQPEPDIKTGHLICRMERYVCGRNLTVCVGLDDDEPGLIVVTVFVAINRGK